MLKKEERVHFVISGYPTMSIPGSHFAWEYVLEKEVVYLHIDFSANLKLTRNRGYEREDCKVILEGKQKIQRIQVNSGKVGQILEAGLTRSREFDVPLQIRLNFGTEQANYNITGGELTELGVDAQVEYAE